MKLGTRRLFASAMLALVACAPLVGLDELHDRPAERHDGSTMEASTDAGTDAATEAAPDAAPQCTTHAECNVGVTNLALCVENKCTPVKREYCLNSMLPLTGKLPVQRANPLIIAAFTPIGGDKPLNRSTVLAYNLALEEINGDGPSGGSGLVVDGVRRDVVMLLCASEPATAPDALNHVVNDLKIPAIIANFEESAFPKLVTDVTLPAGVFVLNPNQTPESVKYLDTKQTVFSLLGPAEDLALTYRPLLDEMSAVAHARRGIPNGDPLRVSLVATENVTDTNMSVVIRQGAYVPSSGGRDVSQAIQINKQTPDVALDAGTFTVDTFKPIEVVDPPNVTAAVNALVNFNPDIIIALTGKEIETLVPVLETTLINNSLDGGGFDAGDSGARYDRKLLPIWILGTRNADRPGLIDYLDQGDPPTEGRGTRAARFSGIQYASASDLTQKTAWLSRMDARYKVAGGTPPPDYTANENSYDAIYWLAYGFYRGKSIDHSLNDSAAFKAGVLGLIDGDGGVSPGPNEPIAHALEVLRTSDATYLGALGRPDIDKAHGMWRANGTVFCYPDPGDGFGTHVTIQYDHRRYLDGGVIVKTPGKFDCPLPN